jgi:hypothetical protein
MKEEGPMHTPNGTPADQLEVVWRKSSASNSSGSCVEVAVLASGEIAVRNSRYPAGPALIYRPGELAAFVAGAKNGEFDDLCLQIRHRYR